ncbi:hypothetical protein [Rhizobium sp. S163]|uniref:hypothetical protein n=1 Tax=Rhizobium sp. S163 TaxID=3055039 RepID=UPI0025A98BA1|nr:hypothetical protein [Rhizobium sp. S163]MDM9645786.1 hypothetical protein [Rhizobium sp. S163]
MQIKTISEVLLENVVIHDVALASIRQCISVLDAQAKDLIEEIQNSDFEASGAIFVRLHEIQTVLAKVSFQHNISLGPRLDDFVREFDRLDEPFIREYWHSKFIAGGVWPTSE